MPVLYPNCSAEQSKFFEKISENRHTSPSSSSPDSPPKAVASASLGSITKFASQDLVQNQPVALDLPSFDTEKTPVKKSTENAAKKRVSGRELRFRRRATSGEILSDKRVQECMCKCTSSFVAVLSSHLQQGARSFYANLTVCGSVWKCPVCAAKIMQRRKNEVSAVFKSQQNMEKKGVMATFTIPHIATDSGQDCINVLLEAHRFFVSGSGFSVPFKKLGYSGTIKSLEVKWSKKNGFHFHLHVLWFFDKKAKIDRDFKNFIVKRWIWAVESEKKITVNQRKDMRVFSVDLHKDADSGSYLCKLGGDDTWGIEAELTMDAYKVQNEDGTLEDRHFSPFELLDLAGKGDQQAAAVFREYAEATKRKHRIEFSRGMKKLAGLQDKSDFDLATEQREVAIFLGRINKDFWYSRVVKFKRQAEVLAVAESGGAAGLVVLGVGFSVATEADQANYEKGRADAKTARAEKTAHKKQFAPPKIKNTVKRIT